MNAADQVIVYGATGDLMRRKLGPALVRLASTAGEKQPFSVVGVARSDMDDEGFRSLLREALPDALRADFDRLAPRVHYQRGDVGDEESFKALTHRLDTLAHGNPVGRLFYLSLTPALFPRTLLALARAGLLEMREGESTAWRRVVVEKPFGVDCASASDLNRDLHSFLIEEQIYRIDHYLGKETVQNLLGFRFHNAIFEPLWNRHHVELVQVTVAEDIGVEAGRGAHYDATGAVRDMVQNHMMQLLALVAMEPPASLAPEAIRGEKVQLLRALHMPDPVDVASSSVRGRYGPGTVNGAPVAGYLAEQGVARDSGTETYAALRLEIANWRWTGVPFLLRHGKRMARRFTEIQVQFRTPPVQLFNRPDGISDAELRRQLRDGSLCEIRPNVLTLAIQPYKAIHLSFGVKRPGSMMHMAPARLDFDYRDHFGQEPADAYERLLLDALRGDQTLFLRSDEIEAAWRYVDGVLEVWRQPGAPPLIEYAAGSWGPAEAVNLFQGCEGTWSKGPATRP